MNAAHYDMVILGSGPGGEGASMQAAKSGKSVAVVESAAAHRRVLHPSRHHSQQGACGTRFFR